MTMQRGTLYTGPTVGDLACIPEELQPLRQWVLFQLLEVPKANGDLKLDKIPIDPPTLKYGSTNDPTTWGTYARVVERLPHALQAWERTPPTSYKGKPATYRGAGIGFVFTASDPFLLVDLDKSLDPATGRIAPWAQAIVDTLASYAQRSVSGTGLHVLVQATIPQDAPKQHDDVQMWDRGRFVAMTGWHLPETPRTIEARQSQLTMVHAASILKPKADAKGAKQHTTPRAQRAGPPRLSDDEILTKAREAQNSAKFTRLWSGDWSGYDSQSEADEALCCLLAFWTRDADQIDTLFQRSGLYREDKWSDRDDYRERTITQALDQVAVQYDPTTYAAERDSHQRRNGSTAGAEDPQAHTPPWPEMAPEAFYGLAGAIVEAIDPYTEADRVAVLLNILVGSGNAIGALPHARVQHDRHPARLDVVQVGESSKGRKGTGWSTPRYLLSQVDPTWAERRVKSGLSSGEGLIYNVRDALLKREPIKDKGRVVDYQEVEADPGEPDKRLLIVEPEFAAALTVMAREGNILSEVVRQAWDDGNLSPLTRNNPMKATGAHISIIGHITRHELLARLDDTSMGNGFANRFLWVLVRRSKLLPHGAAAPEEILAPLVEQLITVFAFARSASALQRDTQANALWEAVYGPLSEGKPGLLGAIISRAEAQVLRLSVLYAVLDQSTIITAAHLKAALAVWEYCEQSALLIFGERLGDPTADRILEALRAAGATGMTDNDMYELFGRHKSANERARALTLLAALGLAHADKEDTGGRPRTVWRAT